MDVKNTVEILDAAIAGAKKAKEVMADGQVTWVEGLQTAITMAPEVFRAIGGADQVPAELKNVDKAELELLAGKGIELAKAVAALFAAGK